MIDLERALTEVAERLDHPASEHAADELRSRLLASPLDTARRRRIQVLVAIAAAIVLVSVGVITIPPARHAVANWLGIGAVEIRRSDHPLPTSPQTTEPAGAIEAAVRLAAARHAVRFAIVTPSPAAGVLTGVDLDRRVPGGLVALTYPRFTLVEIATIATEPPPLAKLVGTTTTVEHVSVHGAPGLWIGGVHQIGYVDRAGRFRLDTMRRSGPVLLWARRGVTYRIEGLPTRAAALRMAASVG